MRTPLYAEIAAALRTEVRAGTYPVGTPLPSERELSRRHGVSRMTARQAITALEREGLVHRDATRGTFVSEPKVALRLGSFTEELARAGRTSSAEVIWTRQREAEPDIAAALQLAVGTALVALQRLRRSDTEPLALETTYYPAASVPNFLEGPTDGSLWGRLREEYGIVPARSSASLEVVTLRHHAANLLGPREGASALLLTRVTTDSDGRPVEFARDLYRADRVALTIERDVD